jgi:hypothetical protein
LRVKAVGIAAGIVISTAAAAENADWFGKRLFDAFADDLRSPAYEGRAPNASPQQRRIPPAPFDSPPFPSADWQIGGTPIIGDANNIAPWPLMEAMMPGQMSMRGRRAESKSRAGNVFPGTCARRQIGPKQTGGLAFLVSIPTALVVITLGLVSLPHLGQAFAHVQPLHGPFIQN